MFTGFLIGLGIGCFIVGMYYALTAIYALYNRKTEDYKLLTTLPTKIGLRVWSTKSEGY